MSVLYDSDPVAWAEEQIGKLEALAELRPNLDLDIAHLSEELDGMSRSDREAVASSARLVMIHLLLIGFSGPVEPRRPWRAEVEAFRVQLRRRVKGVLAPWLDAELETLWAEARGVAALKLAALIDPAPALAEHRPEDLTVVTLLRQGWEL